VRGQLSHFPVVVVVVSTFGSACSNAPARQDTASSGRGATGTVTTTATGSGTDGTSTGTDSTSMATTSGAGGSGVEDPDATTPGSGGAGSGTGGAAPVGDAAADGAPGCDDQRGMPAVCAPPAVDGGCTSVTSYCERLGSLLKPVVHNQVASCIRGLSSCDPSQAARCVKTALFAACDDRSAEYACADVSRACANTVPTTIEECSAFLKGMTEPGRQAVVSCLSPGDGGATCPAGIFACIRSL
jgi:hypothetical protein